MQSCQNNWNQTSYSNKQNRLVYKIQDRPQEEPTLGEEAEALKKQKQEPVNSKEAVTFNTGIDATIKTLAESVYNDKVNVKRYTEKIKNSLSHWIMKEDKFGKPFGIKGLWNFLEKNNCNSAKIIKGELEFYNADGKILIGHLLQAQLSAEPTELEQVASIKREKLVLKNRNIRIDFVKENQAGWSKKWAALHPTVPVPEYPNIQT